MRQYHSPKGAESSSITEWYFWQSKNVLAHRAFTWWVMGCDLGFRLFMFCFVFFNYCFALDKACSNSESVLSGLTSQSTCSTKGFWNSGCCHSWTGKEMHSECFGYWLGLKVCYVFLGFCVMKFFFLSIQTCLPHCMLYSCCMSYGMNEVFKLILIQYTLPELSVAVLPIARVTLEPWNTQENILARLISWCSYKA